MDGWIDGRMDEWIDGGKEGYLNGWMDGQMNEWKNGWMDERLELSSKHWSSARQRTSTNESKNSTYIVTTTTINRGEAEIHITAETTKSTGVCLIISWMIEGEKCLHGPCLIFLHLHSNWLHYVRASGNVRRNNAAPNLR